MRTTPQTYPEYKRTLISGLVNLPAHWQVARLKSLCKRHSLYGANIPATEYLGSGVRFLRTTDITDHGHLTGEGVHLPAQAVTEYILSDGDILVSRSGTVGRSFLYRSDIHGPCAYAGYLVRFVPKTRQIADYIYLFTKTPAFQEFLRTAAISSTIENVNAEKYANCMLPVPPPDEQAAIVRYLDHADEIISRYISAKERLIALLEEQRKAVIHQAVTRGLDPNCPLRPSGIDLLHDVPEHWQITQLKRLSQNGALYGANIPASQYTTHGVRFVRTSDITESGQLTSSGVNISLHSAEGYLLNDGDVLLSRSGTIGRAFLYQSNLHGQCAYAGYLVRFVPNTKAVPKFIFYFTKSQPFTDFLSTTAISSTIENLNGQRYGNAPILVPQPAEQATIVAHIESATEKTDTAANQAHQQISLMNEYRTRLIADVVTGQIDVRNAAVELPD